MKPSLAGLTPLLLCATDEGQVGLDSCGAACKEFGWARAMTSSSALRCPRGHRVSARAARGASRSGGGGIRTLGRPCGRQRFSRPRRNGRNAASQLESASRGNPGGGMNLGRGVCATHQQRSATVLLACDAALCSRVRRFRSLSVAGSPTPRGGGYSAAPTRADGQRLPQAAGPSSTRHLDERR